MKEFNIRDHFEIETPSVNRMEICRNCGKANVDAASCCEVRAGGWWRIPARVLIGPLIITDEKPI